MSVKGSDTTQKIKKWNTVEGLTVLEQWSRDGFTYGEMAQKIGIPDVTLLRWRQNYPKIDKAIKRGKEKADLEVQNALFKAAVGYSKKITKVTVDSKPIDQYGNMMHRTETTEEEVGPNVTACLAWLNNRVPDKWKKNRDNIQVETETDDENITINVYRTPNNKKEKKEEE